jgi:hypothetical protein
VTDQARSTNTTVLGIASLAKTLPVVGAALVLLFVIMKPEASQGFGFPGRLVFWTAHVGLGLFGIVLAARLIETRFGTRMPLLLGIVLSGAVAALALSPLYAAMDHLVPEGLRQPPDDWLDAFAARGPWQDVAAEFLEVAPIFLTAWVVVNLPLLLAGPSTHVAPPRSGPAGGQRPSDAAGQASRPAGGEGDLLSRLPKALGTDIVVISSDLHYLHVHTSLGKCMLLGTLRDAAEQLGDAGMLVHRSHWVAHRHVERLARRGQRIECVLSNGLRTPVSRRNRILAEEWYGRAGNVVSLTGRRSKEAG